MSENKMSQKEINHFAKLLVKANTAYWDAIGYVGEINGIVNTNNLTEDNELLKRLVKAFIKTKKHDNEFISPKTHERDTDDYEDFINVFESVMEELENEV